MPPLLKLDDVYAQYITRYGTVYAVNGVSLEIGEGEILGIVGESGCGKSTLARVMMMNVKPPLHLVRGRVLLQGVELNRLPRDRLKREVWGKQVSLVPQSVMNALNPTMRVRDIIRDFVKVHNPELDDDEVYSMARDRFEELGLDIRALDLYPFELSGGMRQRVAIAIATLLNPKLLIADEPTSALDVSTQKVVLKLLKRLWNEGIVKSIVFITHDIAVVRQIATRIAVMYAGKIVEVGPLEEVIFKPLHPYTELLISSILTPEPEVKKRGLVEIRGAPPDLRTPPRGCPFAERCPYATDRCRREEPRPVVIGSRLIYCHLRGGGAA
ncbi:MAG: ABC transporter ATP-binding protein [Thermoprotei archaeon]|nr:MAG: ABC transporter ATP-binding protein [Thermoprotei archaeon]